MNKEEREHAEYVIQHQYDYARRILKHYFHLLREKTGIQYDIDYDAELEAMIDSIKEGVEWQIKLALAEHGAENCVSKNEGGRQNE